MKPITKKLTEVNDSNKKLEKNLKKTCSENKEQHEIFPVEIDIDSLENESDNIRPLPIIATASDAMRENIGALMKSHIP